MRIVKLAAWLEEYVGNEDNWMFRIDVYGDVNKHGGFIFPPANRTYFTGLGGLHFFADWDAALAYAKENKLLYVYGVPRGVIQRSDNWSCDWMSIGQQPVHIVPTLVKGVRGYTGAVPIRNEIVIPGSPGFVLAVDPDTWICINV